jgi:hypothetical protein
VLAREQRSSDVAIAEILHERSAAAPTVPATGAAGQGVDERVPGGAMDCERLGDLNP